jgi:hypothetical protein
MKQRTFTENIIASNNEVKRKIAMLREQVKIQFPFLADIIERVQIMDAGSATHGGVGATNGVGIEINAGDITGNTKRGVFVLAHEAYHIKRNDVEKTAGKHRGIANIVTDAVINANLRDMGGEFQNGVDIPSAREWGEEKLYDFIIDTLNYMKIDEFREPGQGMTEEDLWQGILGNRGKWYEIVQYHDERQREKEERRINAGKVRDSEQNNADKGRNNNEKAQPTYGISA